MKKYLVSFLDTEGGILHAPLKELSMLFLFTIKTNKSFNRMIYDTSTFHLLNLQTLDVNKKPVLTSHIDSLNILIKYHKCEGIICFGWNVRHDARVLKEYFDHTNVLFVDTIQWAKSVTKFNSYKQKHLMEIYQMGTQTHSSLMDCIDMVNIMKFIQIDYENKGKLTIEDVKIEANLQKESDIFQKILSSNALKPFHIKEVQVIADNYEYYHILGSKYKIRKGFESKKNKNFKGYGLYEYDNLKNRYVLVKDTMKKLATIESILDNYT